VRVIGTAGHVDHGKSTLVEAITGIDPDRLREEKERQMTIDLGFAWMALPSGQEVSLVDVPGHEDFIKNMLAGIGGIDVALFVVAADEGVMPQTREHLAILDILEVTNSVVALTKQDLIDDPEWLMLVEDDLREQLAGTCLQDSPIVPVSALTGAGIPELLAELDKAVAASPERADTGSPRLPIDRAFSLSGFGTIVTGTLSDGHLEVGAEVEILPSGRKSRIRGLQTHKHKVDRAVPGSRVAANLVGIATNEITRGDVVAYPGQYRASRLLDVQLRLIADAPRPLRHDQVVDLYIGASVVPARARILGQPSLAPGQTCWAQLDPVAPIVATKGDRFIIRQPSPSMTIGGGQIVNPHAERRYRRFREETIQRLETMAKGSPEEILLDALSRGDLHAIPDLVAASHLEPDEARRALIALLADGRIIALAAEGLPPERIIAQGKLVAHPERWNALLERARTALDAYHLANPLRAGMPRSELQSRLRLDSRPFNDLVSQGTLEGSLAETASGGIRTPEHQVRFSPEQQAAVDQLIREMASDPYKTPSIARCTDRIGEDVFNALVEQGKLVKVSEEVVFPSSTYEAMISAIVAHLQGGETITLAQVRDLFDTSRRYAAALLEHMDNKRITRRIGDERVLRAG
jgi:selenocysteine-specific elongation factor